MAKKGIRYAVFGLLNEETMRYTGGKHISPVAGFNGAPTASEVIDYGDDRAVESDKAITGGSLSVELNNDAEDIYTMLLGHEKNDEGEIIYNSDDIAPYVGVGAIGLSGDKYIAKFYTKVQFAEPSDANTTRQENTTFNHTTIEGTIFIPQDGVWKKQKEFATEEEAKAYLNGLVGIA